MPGRDPVTHLNRALQSAGGPALSQDQQDKLNALLTQYKAAHLCGTPDPTMQSALRELESAILSKDQATVNSTAAIISAQVAKRANDRIQSMGNLAIQALGVLSDEQVNALKTQYGNMGLLRVFHGAMMGGCGPGFGRWRMMGGN